MIVFIFVVIIFLLLILPHELGHFFAAKASGMRVERLSLGFGPKLWGIKRGETEYIISAFPLGGYTKIAGMQPGEYKTENGFYSKPFRSKVAVLVAGSAMNFLVSILLFSLIFIIGFQTADLKTPVVGGIVPNSPAQRAGIRPGDRIISINNHKIEKWQQMASLIQKEKGKLNLVILRGKKTITVELEPKYYPEYKRKLIGISPSIKYVRYDPLTSIGLGAKRVAFLTGFIFITLKDMVMGKVPVQFAGPVGIVEYVGEATKLGIVPFLSLAALLGINLGLFNLFPIPALDGGRILFLIIEAIRKKPMEIEIQEFVHYIGFLILISLMLLVTYQDILRLVR